METPDSHMKPSSQLELERERMMEEEAHDLPWGRRRSRPVLSGKEWTVLAVGVALALSLPLAYVALGIIGIIVASEAGLVAATLLAIAVVIGGLVALSIYAKRRKALWAEGRARDDFGNFVRNDSIGKETSSMEKLVSQVMSSEPVVCGTLDSLVDCARDMYKLNVGFLVVQNEKLECVGIVTDRDLVCGGLAHDVDPKTTPVTQVMQEGFVSVRPEQSIFDCISVMAREGIRRVPVLDSNRKCVGVVSVDDLILKRACTIDELAPIISRQLSEPNAQHGLSEAAKKDNRAA